MAVKPNGVKMAKTYHHGDLRAALIEAGLRLISERDIEGLSLRETAREVGVSATSVYHHFKDKTALTTAMAEAGLARLTAVQIAAAEAAGGGSAGFVATGRAYVQFALEHPAIFRLIFTSSAAVAAAGDSEASRLLLANVTAELPLGAGVKTVESEAIAAWALVHGLAMLMLDKQLPANLEVIERVLRR